MDKISNVLEYSSLVLPTRTVGGRVQLSMHKLLALWTRWFQKLKFQSSFDKTRAGTDLRNKSGVR